MKNLHALLIGIDRHGPNGLVADLHGAVADVLAMQEYLVRGGVDGKNVRVLTSPHGESGDYVVPTYETIVDGIVELTERAQGASGEALIHFSGHGGRVPTLLPSLKGSSGLDEGLVPTNLDDPQAKYLHDVELTFLLDAMARRGVPVTVILDACHSGGMMRHSRRAVGVRRARGIFTQGRRTESRVAPLCELERVWLAVHHRSQRQGRRSNSGWTSIGVLQRSSVAVLAACRMRESAYERDFGNGPRGTFTHHLLQLFAQGTAMTWREASRTLQRRMLRVSRAQRPVFEGAPSPRLFEGLRRGGRKAIEVIDVDRQRQRVLLDAGVASGIGQGALLEIQTHGGDSEGELVEVEAASVAQSWVVSRVPKGSLDAVDFGDEAKVVDPGWSLRRRVGWLDSPAADGPPASEGALRPHRGTPWEEWVTDLVRDIEAERGFLQWCEEAEDGVLPDFRIAAEAEGYEILAVDGRRIPGVPPIPLDTPKAASRLVDQLVHLARFQAVVDLDNRDQRPGGLCDSLAAQLGILPPGYQPGDEVVTRTLTVEEGVPQIPTGRWVSLHVENLSTQALHLYVLDLSPDWSIEIIHPKGKLTTLEGGRQICIPFEIYLPPGEAGGREIFKVIAVAEPARPLALRLPPIHRGQRKGWRSTHSSTSNPLNRLLSLADRGGPDWRSAAFRKPNSYWTSAQVEFEVINGSKS